MSRVAAKRPRNKPVTPKKGEHPYIKWSRFGLRIAHHHHSGRRLPWHYTSYMILYFLLILAGSLVLFATQQIAKAGQQMAQGSITLSGSYFGPPPNQAAVITSPADGARFDTSTIQVEGQCTQNLFIEIYRNNSFSGQTLCSTQGDFNITITIVPGENTVMARIKDGAGQYGPDSNTIKIFYDVPITHPDSVEDGSSTVTDPGSPGTVARFLVYTRSALHSLQVGKTFSLAYEVNGGDSPYAISINWGDDSAPSVVAHDKEGDFTAQHEYAKAGQYTITIHGSDNRGRTALIQTLIIVHTTEITDISQSTKILLCETDGNCFVSSSLIEIINRYIWPALIIAFLMTLSFYLGERLVYSENRRSRTGRPAH